MTGVEGRLEAGERDMGLITHGEDGNDEEKLGDTYPKWHRRQ
jgi:hypothetical protein